jgi:uncharacterized protein
MPFITRARLTTLALAGGGAAAFWALGMPLPFLFGPMAACLIGALAGAQMQGMGLLQKAMRTILGVAVGASITPALVADLPRMALSVALVPPYILLIGLIGVPFFRRFCGLDRITAYYAAMPGGLQDMIVFGKEAGANVRTLSLIHATRVLIIVSLAPILISSFHGATLDNPVGQPAVDIPLAEILAMAGAALVGWKVAERAGLFGASILGPMIATAALSLADVIHARPPAEAILAAQFFIGLTVGVYYVGVTLREIRHDVLSGAAYVLIMAALAAMVAEIAILAGLAPPLEAFLAFAPGGQAEMTILAIVVGADLGFVVVHHLVRIVLVIAGAPLIARLTRDRGG